MTPQEIINQLITEDNFDKVVAMCLENDELEIPNKCFPHLNIYYYKPGDSGSKWHELNPYTCKFMVDGELKEGIKNFFRFYSKITEFHVPEGQLIYRVKPNILAGGHWSKTEEWKEISWDCHSYSKLAIEKVVSGLGKYCIDGDIYTKKEWLSLCREHKLSRLCGIDLKAERLEKEKLEKAEQKRLKKERKEEKIEWTTYDSKNSDLNWTLYA